MQSNCFGCNQKNEEDQAFCGRCGSPLALSSFVARQVDTRVSEVTKERELVEKESAIRIFDKSSGWAKLVGGIAFTFGALLLAGAAWLDVDLRSSARTAKNEVEMTKSAAEKSITDTATTTRAEIASKAVASLQAFRVPLLWLRDPAIRHKPQRKLRAWQSKRRLKALHEIFGRKDRRDE